MLRRYFGRRRGVNLGLLVLGIWLAAIGFIRLFDVSFTNIDTFLGVLALTAGALIFIRVVLRDLSANLGLLLLSIWLIVYGLTLLVDISYDNSETILALLAVAGGGLLLIGRRTRSLSSNLGLLLAGFWFAVTGLIELIDLQFSNSDTILAVVALVSGVLILLDR